MAAIKAYISKNILPKDKLLRIRVLEQAQDYEVNQTGLLTVQSAGERKRRKPRTGHASGNTRGTEDGGRGRLP